MLCFDFIVELSACALEGAIRGAHIFKNALSTFVEIDLTKEFAIHIFFRHNKISTNTGRMCMFCISTIKGNILLVHCKKKKSLLRGTL